MREIQRLTSLCGHLRTLAEQTFIFAAQPAALLRNFNLMTGGI
jgi:hypothetical protein